MFAFFKKSKAKTHERKNGQPCISSIYQTSNCIASQYPLLEIPDIHFRDLKGMPELKLQVVNACKEITSGWLSGEMSRNGILLYGDPGNGKTAFGKAIAGSYGWPFFEIKSANITSQWVGETARAIKESFDFVKRNAPCVLMLDEMESLIAEVSDKSGKDERDIRNTLLTELVDVRSFPVIVVGATNFYERLSAAAVREGRFDYKIEVKSPDLEARKALISMHSGRAISEQVLDVVAKRYSGFSVKRVMSVAEEAGKLAACVPLSVEHFSVALRKIQGSVGNALRDVAGLTELTFNKNLAVEIDDLVEELCSVDHLLMHRSTPFKGALFYGPPGTGKTALAKAIAKDSGWAFLEVAAPDILADFSKLEEVYRKAKDLRPCVIFIDEATDLLAERTTSSYASHTNKLLTMIDGFGEEIPDVVFIAATNHAENIDEAIARRLYRAITFELPDHDSRIKLLETWARRNKEVEGLILGSLDRLAEETQGMSAANIFNLLDTRQKKAILQGIRAKREPDFSSAF